MLVMFRKTPSSTWSVVLLFSVVASACDGSSGGSSAGGESSANTSADTGVTSNSMVLPVEEPVRPRWILRDKNGAVVPALVEPHCGDTHACRLPEPGASPQFRCVHVKMFQNQYIGLLYGLADGSPWSCSHAARSIDPHSSCSQKAGCGGPYFTGAETDFIDRPDEPRTTYVHEGKLMYISTSAEPVEVQCFHRDVIDGCFQADSTSPRFPILPIQDEVIDLLADGAPYTFEVAYD